jgi:PKD repeat protein
MYRKINQPGPLTAVASGVVNSNQLVAFPMQGVDSAMTCHFQVTSVPGDYSNPFLDRKQDKFDFYGDTGAPDYLPIDLNANLDIIRYSILPTDNLIAANTYGFRVRYRDHNLEWGPWSAEKIFVYSTSTPTATCDFVADSLTVPVGYNVSFSDLSGAVATSWEWDFENNGSVDSYLQDPFHAYSTPGFYTVALTINGGGAGNSATRNSYIHVLGGTELTSAITEKVEVTVFPNPFSSSTSIGFNVTSKQLVTAEISDNSGKVVRHLFAQKSLVGPQTMVWNGEGDNGGPVAAGLYLITIKGETFLTTKNVILQKK